MCVKEHQSLLIYTLTQVPPPTVFTPNRTLNQSLTLFCVLLTEQAAENPSPHMLDTEP